MWVTYTPSSDFQIAEGQSKNGKGIVCNLKALTVTQIWVIRRCAAQNAVFLEMQAGGCSGFIQVFPVEVDMPSLLRVKVEDEF
jgi:hypothetical protein